MVCVREVAYELRGRLLRKRRQKRPSLSPARAFLVNELRGRLRGLRGLRDLPGDSDLYIFCDVLKYLVRMRAGARSSIIMIQLRYVRIS